MPLSETLPLICVPEGGAERLPAQQRTWAAANGFTGQRGRLLPLAGSKGSHGGYLFGTGGEDRSTFVLGLAGAALEPGRYSLRGEFGAPTLSAIAFALGAYRFDRYRKSKSTPELELPEAADAAEVARQVAAATLARDLVNTPANDLGPDAFEREIRSFAASRKMKVSAIIGDDLLKQNFPMIHAVGRAAAEPPRLMDLRWGRANDPKVTLVGKGVTFDTGGLDIKPSAGMLLMK